MEILNLTADYGRIEGMIKTKAFIPTKFLPGCVKYIGETMYFLHLPEADYFVLSDIIEYLIDIETKLERENKFIEAAINGLKSTERDI